jgi:hypothetical protein
MRETNKQQTKKDSNQFRKNHHRHVVSTCQFVNSRSQTQHHHYHRENHLNTTAQRHRAMYQDDFAASQQQDLPPAAADVTAMLDQLSVLAARRVRSRRRYRLLLRFCVCCVASFASSKQLSAHTSHLLNTNYESDVPHVFRQQLCT